MVVYSCVLRFQFQWKSLCLCFTIPISIKEIHYLYYGVLYVQEGDASELSRPIQTMQWMHPTHIRGFPRDLSLRLGRNVTLQHFIKPASLWWACCHVRCSESKSWNGSGGDGRLPCQSSETPPTRPRPQASSMFNVDSCSWCPWHLTLAWTWKYFWLTKMTSYCTISSLPQTCLFL